MKFLPTQYCSSGTVYFSGSSVRQFVMKMLAECGLSMIFGSSWCEGQVVTIMAMRYSKWRHSLNVNILYYCDRSLSGHGWSTGGGKGAVQSQQTYTWSTTMDSPRFSRCVSFNPNNFWMTSIRICLQLWVAAHQLNTSKKNLPPV